jgi:FG-GAP-like repeat
MNTRTIHYRLAVCLVLSLALSTAMAEPSSFRYVDESARLPLDTNPPDTDTLDVDFADVDDDGDLDIYIADGTASPAPRANKLYINDGGGSFSDESSTRLPNSTPANSTEVDFADADGDGDLDAIVANLGPEQLLLNDGSGYFIDASSTNLPAPLSLFNNISSEARFIDVDNDGDKDILVANENPFNPAVLGGVQNRIWLNDGAAHFTDETSTRLPQRTDQSQGFASGDIDHDGDIDLIVVNIGQDIVLINNGHGFFTDETSSRFPITTDSSRKGVLADLNGDHCLDLFMGNSRNQQNRLYLNNCHGIFIDRTAGNVPQRADTTSDVDLVDIDKDGDLDVYTTNSGDFQVGHGFLGDTNIYLRNNGHARFQDKTALYFSLDTFPSTDAEFGDVDGDHELDLMIGNSSSVNGNENLYIRTRCPGESEMCN